MVLGAPDGGERATVNDIAAALQVEAHTITGAVIRAEEAGLVTREPCVDDRRRTWVRVTPEGRRRLDHALALLEARREREPVLAAIEPIVDRARALTSPGQN
jgi:DNA-binding MarR family transcriptional regulator